MIEFRSVCVEYTSGTHYEFRSLFHQKIETANFIFYNAHDLASLIRRNACGKLSDGLCQRSLNNGWIFGMDPSEMLTSHKARFQYFLKTCDELKDRFE